MTQTNKTELNLIISEYLRAELMSKGHNWELRDKNLDQTELILSDSRRKNVVHCLCILSHLMKKTFKVQLKQMCLKLESEIDDLTNLDYELFESLANELFSERIRWSHLISLLVFATELILITINENPSRDFIDNIHFYLCTYLNNHLLQWINDNQAWQGLISYCNQESLSSDSLVDKILSKIHWSNRSVRIGTISFLSIVLVYCFLRFKK